MFAILLSGKIVALSKMGQLDEYLKMFLKLFQRISYTLYCVLQLIGHFVCKVEFITILITSSILFNLIRKIIGLKFDNIFSLPIYLSVYGSTIISHS